MSTESVFDPFGTKTFRIVLFPVVSIVVLCGIGIQLISSRNTALSVIRNDSLTFNLITVPKTRKVRSLTDLYFDSTYSAKISASVPYDIYIPGNVPLHNKNGILYLPKSKKYPTARNLNFAFENENDLHAFLKDLPAPALKRLRKVASKDLNLARKLLLSFARRRKKWKHWKNHELPEPKFEDLPKEQVIKFEDQPIAWKNYGPLSKANFSSRFRLPLEAQASSVNPTRITFIQEDVVQDKGKGSVSSQYYEQKTSTIPPLSPLIFQHAYPGHSRQPGEGNSEVSQSEGPHSVVVDVVNHHNKNELLDDFMRQNQNDLDRIRNSLEILQVNDNANPETTSRENAINFSKERKDVKVPSNRNGWKPNTLYDFVQPQRTDQWNAKGFSSSHNLKPLNSDIVSISQIHVDDLNKLRLLNINGLLSTATTTTVPPLLLVPQPELLTTSTTSAPINPIAIQMPMQVVMPETSEVSSYPSEYSGLNPYSYIPQQKYVIPNYYNLGWPEQQSQIVPPNLLQVYPNPNIYQEYLQHSLKPHFPPPPLPPLQPYYPDSSFWGTMTQYFRKGEKTIAQNVFEVTILILAFIAFGMYIFMIFYQTQQYTGSIMGMASPTPNGDGGRTWTSNLLNLPQLIEHSNVIFLKAMENYANSN